MTMAPRLPLVTVTLLLAVASLIASACASTAPDATPSQTPSPLASIMSGPVPVSTALAGPGELLWRYGTGIIGSYSLLSVGDGAVYVGSEDGNWNALDAATGETRWQYEAGSSDGMFAPTVVDGVAWTKGTDPAVRAMEAASGKILRQFGTGIAAHSPVVADGVVFVLSLDENEPEDDSGPFHYRYRVQALDDLTGSLLWQYERDQSVALAHLVESLLSSSLTIAEGAVFVAYRDGLVQSLGAATGGLRWSYEAGEMSLPALKVADGTVYVGSTDSYVYALDAADGKLRWRYQTGSGVYGAPAAADGVVYVGSSDSHVYALGRRHRRTALALPNRRWRDFLSGGCRWAGVRRLNRPPSVRAERGQWRTVLAFRDRR